MEITRAVSSTRIVDLRRRSENISKPLLASIYRRLSLESFHRKKKKKKKLELFYEFRFSFFCFVIAAGSYIRIPIW